MKVDVFSFLLFLLKRYLKINNKLTIQLFSHVDLNITNLEEKCKKIDYHDFNLKCKKSQIKIKNEYFEPTIIIFRFDLFLDRKHCFLFESNLDSTKQQKNNTNKKKRNFEIYI